MFDRLGHVTFRHRRAVLALAGVFLAVGRVLGHRRLRLDDQQRLRHPRQRVGPGAGAHRGQRRAGRRRRGRALPRPQRRRGPGGRRPGVPGRGRAAPGRAAARPGRVGDDVLDGRPGGRAARLHDGRSTYAVVQLARGRRGRAAWTPTPSSSRRCATPRRGSTSGSVATRRSASDITSQVSEDIARAEQISLPIVLVLLVVIFGGLTAAALPLAVGGLAILGAFTMLRLLSLTTDVSIFAVNIVTMLGLGLAIDYALFVVSRFREEIRVRQGHRAGAARDDGHRGPHRRVLRPDGRDLARVAALLPAGVPAVDGLRRDGGRARRRCWAR